MAVAADTNSVRRSRTKFPAVAVLVAAVTIYAALETATYIVYNHPGLLTLARSNIIVMAFRSLYRAQLPLIQWEPACSQYNATLGNFTLRPGRCRHATPEFSVEISANSMGLRDSEAALTGPDVIVLGASFAMGWGVEDHDTIARRVEHATGLRVLNAAMPGYSLRQSLSLLTHLDRSRLRYLVISYFLPQDTRSIHETLRQGQPATEFRLPRDVYDNAVAQYLVKRRSLGFGRYLVRLIASFATMTQQQWNNDRAADDALYSADLYEMAGRDVVALLDQAAPLLGDSKVILVPGTPACRRIADRVADSIDAALAAGLKRMPNPLAVTRVDAEIDGSYCFVLDNHLNARAHSLFASRVSEIILRDPGGRP